jgi:hypothetical protein
METVRNDPFEVGHLKTLMNRTKIIYDPDTETWRDYFEEHFSNPEYSCSKGAFNYGFFKVALDDKWLQTLIDTVNTTLGKEWQIAQKNETTLVVIKPPENTNEEDMRMVYELFRATMRDIIGLQSDPDYKPQVVKLFD